MDKNIITQFKHALVTAVSGCVLIIGLFFWYKSFAYYTHDIHTYNFIAPVEDGQLIYVLDRLKNHYETVIQNNSTSEIMADVYKDGSNPILLQENILISPGEEYWFDSGEYAYKVLISGEDISEDQVNVTASTLRYLKSYRKSVVITMIAGILLTFFWTVLMIAVPEKVKKYGVKINMIMTVFLAVGSVFFCLAYDSGYIENDLCFLALLCTAFVAVMKKSEGDNSVVLPEEAFLTAGILSMLVSCLIFCCMLNSTETSPLYVFNARNKMSLPDYAITVILFLGLFVVFSVVFAKHKKITASLKNHMGTELAVCGMAVTFSLLVQQEILGIAGNVMYFTGVLLMLAVLLAIYDRTGLQSAEGKTFAGILRKALVYLSYAVTIAVVAISVTAINYFHMGDRTGDYVHHISTYFRPMYYVKNHISAGGGIELYGHYAFLYKLPMEIFGGNLLTLGIMTGIIGGLTAFFAIGTMHMLTKSAFLRVIGAIAIMDILCRELYLAIVPHRLLFPLMMLFYIVFCKKRTMHWLSVAMGFLISILAVFWNTETGAVVMITWIAFLVFKAAVEKEWKLGHMLRLAAAAAGIFLLTLAVAAGIFTLYCVLIKGISVSDINGKLFGQLLNPQYMFAAHFNFIRWTNAPWIYIMIFLLGMLAYGISGTGLLGKCVLCRKKEEMPVIISIAVMGLGQFVYFISRPEDYSIMVVPAVLCMIIYLDAIRREPDGRKVLTEGFNKGGSVLFKRLLSVIILFGFSCILVLSKDICSNVFQRCTSGHQLDYGLLQEDLKTFSEQVPQDTFAELDKEEGLACIYLCLGWEVPKDLGNTEYIITRYVREYTDYKLIEEIPFGDMEYYLYQKADG